MSRFTESGGDVDGAHNGIVRDEVTHWFFDDYLPTWMGVGSGAIACGPEFILDYWDVPLHVSTPTSREWLLDKDPPVQNRSALHLIYQYPMIV